MVGATELFELDGFAHKGLFDDVEYAWEGLSRLKGYLKQKLTPNLADLQDVIISETLILHGGKVIREKASIDTGDVTKGGLRVILEGEILDGASVIFAGASISGGDIQIGKGSVIEPGAFIKGPTIIGDFTEVRQGAYVRGTCLVGNRCVVGHTTELKSAVMLNGSKAGHFAYIGDSILGNDVNLGAGTKLANLKIISQDVTVRIEGKVFHTGLRKMGAILGDRVEMGCNSVSNPGVVMGKGSMVYPCVSVPSGYYPARTIISMRSRDVLTIRTR
ncbi:MAG: glucose-1-phosphate thymidylyltransferase [Desulfobacteraceae bacterium]|nr:MAG: glucose-1-phosphate thymidylyltransferase [Desulfobacteraceae bacterium]